MDCDMQNMQTMDPQTKLHGSCWIDHYNNEPQIWTLSAASCAQDKLSHILKIVKWLLQAGFFAKACRTKWQ